MPGVILARLDFGNVSQVAFPLSDGVEELVVIIQDSGQCDNPIAKSTSCFEQAAAIVWPGRRQQQPVRRSGSLALPTSISTCGGSPVFKFQRT